MIRLAAGCTIAASLLTALPAAAQIVTASPTYFQAQGKLTAAEMQSTFTGRYREDGVDAAGHAWTIEAMPNGTLSVTAGSYVDDGHARLDGARLCVTWKKAWQGEERCFRYAHHGKELASYGPDGNLDSVLTLTHNPQ